MEEEILNIKNKYRNIIDGKVFLTVFIFPVLNIQKNIIDLGFWNSSFFISWAESLPFIIKDYKNRKIKLLMSKNLDPVDYYKMLELRDNEEEIKKYLRIKTEDILNDAIDFSKIQTTQKKNGNFFLVICE